MLRETPVAVVAMSTGQAEGANRRRLLSTSRRRLGRLLASGMLALTTGAGRPHGATPPPPHDMHLTYSRIVVDGRTIVCRVRLFHDDLELALRKHSGRTRTVVGATPAVDSIFASYFNASTSFTADGTRLRGRVRLSGEDHDATDQRMWWYEVELPATRPIRRLTIRMGLMFDVFGDQRNIVTLVKMPGADRYSLLFAAGDNKEETITW